MSFISYRDGINKAYKQLESISSKAGPKKAQIKAYIDGTQEHIQKIANSLFVLDDLDTAADTQMKKLQEEWRNLSEKKIKERLREVNFKIGYDSMAAVCGSDRIEVVSLVLHGPCCPVLAVKFAEHKFNPRHCYHWCRSSFRAMYIS